MLCVLVGTGFQVLFHSPPGVLFTFPSRYCSSIGHQVVFRLGGWSPRNLFIRYVSPNPKELSPLVWPLPRSLATTCGISVDFSSSSYLDVSVQTVPHVRLFYSTHVDRLFACRVAPFGNLRIDAYVPLPVAYRSLSRPSSAPDAKASSLRPSSLDLRRSRLAPFRFRARLRLPRKLHIRSSAAPLKIKCQAFDFEFLGSLKNSCPRIMQAPLTEVVLIVVFRYPLRLLT